MVAGWGRGAVKGSDPALYRLRVDVHIQTDYGDEFAGLTPWELFDEADASYALAMAEEAVTLAQRTFRELQTAGRDRRE